MRCPDCDGQGVRYDLPHTKRESPVAPGLMVWQPPRCERCGGTGETDG